MPRIFDIVFLPRCSKETSLAIFGDKLSIPRNFFDGTMTAANFFNVIVDVDRPATVYGNPRNTKEIDTIKDFLCGVKSMPKYYASKLELLTINSLKDAQSQLFNYDDDFYMLRGSPGSGKTILMLGKCMELISLGKKCLYLTYNRQLVLDLERLQEAVKAIAPSNPLVSLRIETWESFIARLHGYYKYFRPLGGAPPGLEKKSSEILSRYNRNAAVELLSKDEEQNARYILRYSSIDYVFVDEAQDLPPAVFDILRLFFGNHICLAIGDQQEYSSVVLKESIHELYLEKIYRQKEVPSLVVRSFLGYAQLDHTYQIQSPVPLELVGGDALVYTGTIGEQLYEQIFHYLGANGHANIDLLHLHTSHGDSSANTTIGHYFGGNVGVESNIKLDRFRYYHYNSCRGLEGTVVIYENIDAYYEWCVGTFGEQEAKKRLFIALTRVKDVAVFTFSDLNHWLYKNVVAKFSKINDTFELG